VTAREREILTALSAGATPGQVAMTLGISPRTVHKHLEHIYRKLGVSHAGAAIARSRQRDVVTGPERSRSAS
jgi:DNA-binding CsgD family transcriptional regulator